MFCLAWDGEGEVAQTMYTHVSKCKNDKIKKNKKVVLSGSQPCQRIKEVFYMSQLRFKHDQVHQK
jgi:hypothetical protein